MDIKQFLAQEQALINLRASDKPGLLHDLAARAGTALEVAAARVAAELLKREQLGSTGTGGGVAIPHARMQEVRRPFGVLARLNQSIEFDAIDGQQVDIVFMLLLPSVAAGEHLTALAAVARKLRDSERLGRLRRARKAEDLYSALAD